MPMQQKILWAAVAVTATTWFGCAEHKRDQNYKILEEDRPMFETEPRTRGSMGGWMFPTIAGAYADEPLIAKPAEAKAADAKPAAAPTADAKPAPAAAMATTQPAAALSAADDKPSLNGLDRSHWGKIKVTPAAAKTSHYPIYFTDLKEPCTRVSDPYVPTGEGHEAQINAALDGSTAHYKIEDHALQLGEQPLKFALDIVLLPARAVMTPPWRDVTTP